MRSQLLAALVLSAGLMFTAGYSNDQTTVAASGFVSSPAQQPGSRCTRFEWPKLTKQQIKDFKDGKFAPIPASRCARMYGKRTAKIFPNQAPVISGVTTAGAKGSADTGWALPPSGTLTFTTRAADPDGDTLLYFYSTTGGRVTGDGPTTTWDLNGVRPGTYTISAEVDDSCGCISFQSATVNVP